METPVSNADVQAVRRKHVRQAYLYHMILAGCIALVLAMTLHLWIIKAAPDVVGGGLFLLFIWVGLPILFSFGAAVFYCHRTRYDKRLTLLTALLVATIAVLAVLPEPSSFIVSIVLALLYIGLAVFFRLTLEKQEPK